MSRSRCLGTGGDDGDLKNVVLMKTFSFLGPSNGGGSKDSFDPDRSGFSRIRPRILHSVVGSLFAKGDRKENVEPGD